MDTETLYYKNKNTKRQSSISPAKILQKVMHVLIQSFALWIFFSAVAWITLGILEVFIDLGPLWTMGPLFAAWFLNIPLSILLSIVLPNRFFEMKNRAMLASVGITAILYSAIYLLCIFLSML